MLNNRLKLKSKFRRLSESELKAFVQKRTIKGLFVSRGSEVAKARAESPGTIRSPRAEAGAGRGVEGWVPRGGLRTRRAGARVPNRPDIALFPQVFHIWLLDLAALLVLVGLSIVLAYFSVFFAFLLLHVVY
jgi:hypothetical protein